jgi:S1-C subfamily serine protease
VIRRPRFGRTALAVIAALVLGACGRWAPTLTVPETTASPVAPLSPLPPATGSDARLVEVVARVQPSVVSVLAEPLEGGDPGIGTGFVVRSEGIIVTNYHVVEGAGRLTVVTVPPDPQRLEARVIGGDPDRDLAVLQVDAEGLAPVTLGRSADLRLGERVLAIGYALGLGADFEGGSPTVTSGIVSALDRTVQASDPNSQAGVRTYTGVIQTDAAINPGNSGGPLLNLRGEVVGINTAGAADAENIGFAIAMDQARPVIERAIENPSQPAPYLGVTTQTVTPSIAVQLGLAVDEGAYVVGVAPGSGAEEAGIQPGEVIVALGGRAVTSSETLGEAIDEHRPEDRVEIELVRQDGSRRTVTATLGVRPLP